MYLVLPGCITNYSYCSMTLTTNQTAFSWLFLEMLNKSYFKLLAYVPTLHRLLVLHKTLQRFLWNVVNITEIQERCSTAWGVYCTRDAGVALTTSRGTRQVAPVSFTAQSYRFVSMFSYLYRCILSYTKYRDAPIYRCIVPPLQNTPVYYAHTWNFYMHLNEQQNSVY